MCGARYLYVNEMMSSAHDTGTTEPCPRRSHLESQLQQQAVELFDAGLPVHHPYYCVFNPDTGYEELLRQGDGGTVLFTRPAPVPPTQLHIHVRA